MRYAEVAVNAPVNQTYTYHIPPEWGDRLQPGHLVSVNFKVGTRPGVVLALHATSPIEKTKPVLELFDERPVMPPPYLALARWLSETYLAPPGLCVWQMLPQGISGHRAERITLLDPAALSTDRLQQAILDALQAGPLLVEELKKHVDQPREVAGALKALEKAGHIQRQQILLPSTVRPKTRRIARLTLAPQDIDEATARMVARKRALLQALAEADDWMDAPELLKATGAKSGDLLDLARRGWLALDERVVWRDALADRDFVPVQAPPLTPDQARVWDEVQRALAQRQARTYLLHGVTGSGKTEIYLRAMEAVVQRGQQAVFLVPEIALTPQTIRRVASRFERVAVFHSELKPKERYDVWKRARDGLVDVIIGTRSALFTPLPDVGLIVLDEEHDHSYKQEPFYVTEQPEGLRIPPYHARAAAEALARANDALVILGSATPDIVTRYRAERGEIAYLHLPQRIMGHRERVQTQAQRLGIETVYRPTDSPDTLTTDLPPVEIVDMRAELKAGHTHMFSRALMSALEGVLSRGEQAIIFLNRRGEATYVFCRDCGYVAECERCEAPLTYHREGEKLRCHHCGHAALPPRQCPTCGSARIRYFGAGTQHVEAELKRTFPTARTVRWDADTAANARQHEHILGRFMRQEAQVMVGTQMVAKGLDLPLVTLVGVVSADPGLNLPDYQAGERAFQLLTQVAGRAGRGLLGGRVILQTYQPEHEAIRAAAQHDDESFYHYELAHRRELGYPPFRRLVRVLIRSSSPTQAERQAHIAAAHLQHLLDAHHLTGTHILGPAPCFYRKIDNVFRWHVLLRGPDPVPALRAFQLRPGWRVDIDPVDLL